jgi:hypothetical protein
VVVEGDGQGSQRDLNLKNSTRFPESVTHVRWFGLHTNAPLAVLNWDAGHAERLSFAGGAN